MKNDLIYKVMTQLLDDLYESKKHMGRHVNDKIDPIRYRNYRWFLDIEGYLIDGYEEG